MAGVLDLVEAPISELQGALTSGSVTCVELVSRYLQRISQYDCRGPSLNSIPIINPKVLEEAAASDDRRAAGLPPRPLEGIPYTVKDSFKVKGLTVASGSPAFQNLMSNEDAFTVAKLREAGAILIGKTNMPPMAAGGMQRGVYGRAESPYNPKYLAAAFASGSSNGSAVSTAASFATFGMGEETVSSGRSPASNNGLCAYTPSRGCISIRGNWPLYVTCDVIVPHTRTIADMLTLLDIITVPDPITQGDFWRDQAFIDYSKPWLDRPRSFQTLLSSPPRSLEGLRIAVPAMYIGGQCPPGALPVVTCAEVVSLFSLAKSDLESLGASVIITPDFPLVTEYEALQLSTAPSQSPSTPQLPINWNAVERSKMIAYAWDAFLRLNGDPKIPNLPSVDSSRVFPPFSPTDPQVAFSEPSNAIHWTKLSSFVESSDYSKNSIFNDPNLGDALHALESMRKIYLEDWMTGHNYDLVIFPAAGDVGAGDADINHQSAEYAWKNGVKYSNGNRALRHLGVPSVTVPMGLMSKKRMPVGLTFVGRSGDDTKLLGWAGEFEKSRRRRESPKRTPRLESDLVELKSDRVVGNAEERSSLDVRSCIARVVSAEEGVLEVSATGMVTMNSDSLEPVIEMIVDGKLVPEANLLTKREADPSKWSFECKVRTPAPPEQDARNKTEAKVARDQTMVVILAKNRKSAGARATGWINLI